MLVREGKCWGAASIFDYRGRRGDMKLGRDDGGGDGGAGEGGNRGMEVIQEIFHCLLRNGLHLSTPVPHTNNFSINKKNYYYVYCLSENTVKISHDECWDLNAWLLSRN